MKSQPQTRWLVDAILFLGFICAFLPDVTGVEAHQWLGIVGGALAAFHLAAHRTWVAAVVRRFWGRTSITARIYLLMDAGIMLGFAGIIGTGLVISTWLNLDLSRRYPEVLALHIVASIGTLLIVVFKVALHWRWIAAIGRKVLEPDAAPARPAARTPAGSVSRREFLSVMGLTGLAATVALASGASRLIADLPGESVAGTSASVSLIPGTNEASPSPVAQVQNTAQNETEASAACSIACGRGCSFPGRCRRYADGNSNGLCDWGECL